MVSPRGISTAFKTIALTTDGKEHSRKPGSGERGHALDNIHVVCETIAEEST
jgi:hypothetical protein